MDYQSGAAVPRSSQDVVFRLLLHHRKSHCLKGAFDQNWGFGFTMHWPKSTKQRIAYPGSSRNCEARDNTNRVNSVFQPRVSFDTFDRPADFIEENSFTLIRKHKDYEYTKRSRTFLCGLDSNDYSEYALEWLIDELVDDGDEIVCLRVVEKDDKVAGESSLDHGQYRAEAEKLMERIQAKNTENKAINLVLEFSVGKVNKVIDEMVRLAPYMFQARI